MRTVTFLSLLMLLQPLSAVAFTAVFNDLPEPYGVLTIEDPSQPAAYYGELDGYPDTYEFTLTEATEVVFQLFSYPPDGPTTFSGILVREQTGGGVKEIARLTRSGAWEPVRDGETKLTYGEGPSFGDTLPAATYRFEVSNAENTGQYMLQIQDGSDDAGYFASLGSIASVYAFHDRSVLGMLWVPLVYLPLGIGILLLLIYLTVRYRKQRGTTNPTTTPMYDL